MPLPYSFETAILKIPGDTLLFLKKKHFRALEPADILYHRGELSADRSDIAGVRKYFTSYLQKAAQTNANSFQFVNAFLILGRFNEAFNCLSRMDMAALPAEIKMELSNPWHNLRDAQELRRLLKAFSAAGVKARKSPFYAAYSFILSASANRQAPGAAAVLYKGIISEKDGSFAERAWLHFKTAEVLLNSGFYKEAAAVFKRLIGGEPGNIQAWGRLAEALFCSGGKKQALALLQKGYAKTGDAALKVWRGELNLWAGNYAGALRDLNHGGAGNHMLASCWRGAALFKTGRDKEAEFELKRYVAARPCDLEARLWLSEIYESRGLLHKAEKEITSILHENPTHLWGWINRGILHGKKKDPAALLRDFKLSPAMSAALAKKAGIKPGRNYSHQEIELLLKTARTLARGCRRHETYILPVWLKAWTAAKSF